MAEYKLKYTGKQVDEGIEAAFNAVQAVVQTNHNLEGLAQRVTNHEQVALTESDRQDIITDALAALAGADPSNANAAVIETLNGRTGTLEAKVKNMTEDVSIIQKEIDELETYFIEYIFKTVMRLVQLERHLGLQPPVSDDLDTNIGIEDNYDDLFGQT